MMICLLPDGSYSVDYAHGSKYGVRLVVITKLPVETAAILIEFCPVRERSMRTLKYCAALTVGFLSNGDTVEVKFIKR